MVGGGLIFLTLCARDRAPATAHASTTTQIDVRKIFITTPFVTDAAHLRGGMLGLISTRLGRLRSS
jgi:hypothetical protein